jgi:hypothetical protein
MFKKITGVNENQEEVRKIMLESSSRFKIYIDHLKHKK